jgi:hypothetical protein
MNADFQNLNRLSVTEVPVENVRLLPGPFTMSYGFSVDVMKASLKTGGLMNLPLLLKSEAGDFLIVSGYRRITALLELGYKHIPARLLEEHQISFLDAFLINFYDNLATREFNPVEKGMILGRLADHLTEDQLLDFYMGLLALPPRRSTLANYISFDRDLDEPTKQALAGGTISESTAGALLALPEKERKAVAALFSKVTFNMNQQTQLFELLSDNSRIAGISIAEMLEAKAFLDILATPSMNRPQMARALLALLRARRFPRLTRAEDVFKKRVAKLQLPPGIRIQAPPYFESELYRMEISFRNGQELEAMIDRLGNVDGLREIQDPWEGTE